MCAHDPALTAFSPGLLAFSLMGASLKYLPISTQTIVEPLIAISARTGAANAPSELVFYKNVT